MDSNKDGVITFDEFCEWCQKVSFASHIIPFRAPSFRLPVSIHQLLVLFTDSLLRFQLSTVTDWLIESISLSLSSFPSISLFRQLSPVDINPYYAPPPASIHLPNKIKNTFTLDQPFYPSFFFLPCLLPFFVYLHSVTLLELPFSSSLRIFTCPLE